MIEGVLFESSIHFNIRGKIIHFTARYDITGRVFSLENLFSKLPLSAKKLQFGKKFKEIDERIKVYENAIKIIVPLDIFGNDNVFKEELLDVRSNILGYLNNNSLDTSDLLKMIDEHTFEYYMLSIQTNPELYHEDLLSEWKEFKGAIVDLLANDDDKLLYWFSSYPQFRYEFVRLLIPLMRKPNNRSGLFRSLYYYTNSSCRDYLLNQLNKISDVQELMGVFEGLSNQKFKNEEHILLDILGKYNSIMKNNTNAYSSCFVDVINSFTYPIVKDVLLDVIMEFKEWASCAAFKSYVEIGIDVQKAYDFIFHKINSSNIEEARLALRILSASTESHNYIDNVRELCLRYFEIIHSEYCSDTTTQLSCIFTIKELMFVEDLFLAALYNDNENIVKGAMSIIVQLTRRDICQSNSDFYSNEALSKYIELLESKDYTISNWGYFLIGKVGYHTNNQCVLDLLINKVLEQNSVIIFSQMDAINLMLTKLTYDERITSIYMRAIENNDNLLIKGALIGLKHCTDKHIRKSLKRFEHDNNKMIRAAWYALDHGPKDNGFFSFCIGFFSKFDDSIFEAYKAIEMNLSIDDVLEIGADRELEKLRLNILKYKLFHR